ncbi:hypothetical protein CyaNS01_01117 [Cyanobium sp. NS01]|nr:hypothetical protein CyaNS01_01117 [Cyanobium sp. NS01]
MTLLRWDGSGSDGNKLRIGYCSAGTLIPPHNAIPCQHGLNRARFALGDPDVESI